MRRAFTKLEIPIVFVALGVTVILLFPVFMRPRQNDGSRNSGTMCMSNLKQIGLGITQYTQDYDEKFPPVSTGERQGWVNVLQPYLKSWRVFRCPIAQGTPEQSTSYFYNSRVARLEESKVIATSNTILIGDGAPDSPNSAWLVSLPRRWVRDSKSPAHRHSASSKATYWFANVNSNGANYGFVDGHVKWIQPEKVALESPKTTSNYTFLPR